MIKNKKMRKLWVFLFLCHIASPAHAAGSAYADLVKMLKEFFDQFRSSDRIAKSASLEPLKSGKAEIPKEATLLKESAGRFVDALENHVKNPSVENLAKVHELKAQSKLRFEEYKTHVQKLSPTEAKNLKSHVDQHMKMLDNRVKQHEAAAAISKVNVAHAKAVEDFHRVLAEGSKVSKIANETRKLLEVELAKPVKDSKAISDLTEKFKVERALSSEHYQKSIELFHKIPHEIAHADSDLNLQLLSEAHSQSSQLHMDGEKVLLKGKDVLFEAKHQEKIRQHEAKAVEDFRVANDKGSQSSRIANETRKLLEVELAKPVKDSKAISDLTKKFRLERTLSDAHQQKTTELYDKIPRELKNADNEQIVGEHWGEANFQYNRLNTKGNSVLFEAQYHLETKAVEDFHRALAEGSKVSKIANETRKLLSAELAKPVKDSKAIADLTEKFKAESNTSHALQKNTEKLYKALPEKARKDLAEKHMKEANFQEDRINIKGEKLLSKAQQHLEVKKVVHAGTKARPTAFHGGR